MYRQCCQQLCYDGWQAPARSLATSIPQTWGNWRDLNIVVLSSVVAVTSRARPSGYDEDGVFQRHTHTMFDSLGGPQSVHRLDARWRSIYGHPETQGVCGVLARIP